MIKRLQERYVNRYLSPYIVLIFDITITFVLFVLSYHILNNFKFNTLYPFLAEKKSIIPVIVYFCSFMLLNSYRGILRHATIKDTLTIFKASLLALVVLVLLKFLFNDCLHLSVFPPLSVLIIHFLLVVFILALSRAAISIIYSYVIDTAKELSTHVLIYGAGSAGLAVTKALLHDTTQNYKIVGFIDDNAQLNKMKVLGIPIYSKKKALTKEFIIKNSVEMLVIAIIELNTDKKKDIVENGLNLGLKVRIIPSLDKWIDGELTTNQLRKIKIEELLERKPIKMENDNVTECIKNKVVFITGAAGSIGSEIARQVIKHNPKQLILIDQAETPSFNLQQELLKSQKLSFNNGKIEFVVASITDQVRLRKIFTYFPPDIIFHAAAYKHVPLMEENPYEAITTNVFGTKNLAELAIEFKADRFVMISTDKAINPTNVMGATKRTAEILIQNIDCHDTQFITTRFGNVLGSNGSVVPIFEKQIENGGPITITDKRIIRYFMTIPEACNLVLEAGTMGKGGDIFVFDMGQQVKIYDLAKKMISLANYIPDKDIKIIETGLRPGEKLYEELLSNEENTQPTHHPKIMIAKTRSVNFEQFTLSLEKLSEITPTGNNMAMVSILKEIIPEYISNNSIYSTLDKKP